MNQFAYQEDWGEKYDNLGDLGIYLLNLSKNQAVEVPGIDFKSLTPGQPKLGPAGNYLVYTAWKSDLPRKLGMIYCYIVLV